MKNLITKQKVFKWNEAKKYKKQDKSLYNKREEEEIKKIFCLNEMKLKIKENNKLIH